LEGEVEIGLLGLRRMPGTLDCEWLLGRIFLCSRLGKGEPGAAREHQGESLFPQTGAGAREKTILIAQQPVRQIGTTSPEAGPSGKGEEHPGGSQPAMAAIGHLR
jgi:hypothetical protein